MSQRVKISPCKLRGLASQLTKCLLELRARAWIICVAFLLTMAASVSCAVADLPYIFALIFVAVLGLMLPFFCCQTMSCERARGAHFSPLDCGHRRGVLVLGKFIAESLLCLIMAMVAYFGYVLTSIGAHGGFVLGVEELFCGILAYMSALVICAINCAVSAYSTRRITSVGFVALAAAAVLVSAGLFGAQQISKKALLLALEGAAAIFLLGLSYFAYRLRARILGGGIKK